jgi:hypothetical protein
MSTFTMRLKDVIRHTDGKIGLDDYPLTDESHRGVLNAKIVARYFNREIGVETIDLFTHNLRRKMHEIMPLYDQLYQSQLIKFDPLDTLNIRSESSSTTEAKSKGEAETDSKSVNKAKAVTVSSDFPQQSLKDSDAYTGEYASGSSESNSDSENDGNSNEKRNDESTANDSTESTSKGYTGAAAVLLMQYRESLANYDLEIVNSLNELFMSIWQTSESFSNEGMYY